MELRHLRFFVTVAQERNFTRAAERVGIAQPPLSRQIRDLEQELGAVLFDRGSRPIRLTEAGRLLYEQAVQIIASVEQVGRTIRQFASAQQSRFVIGVVGSIMHGALPEVIRMFRRRALEIDVELVELTTVEQVAALKAGRIDAGLGRVRIDDPAIRREILYEEPLIAALFADDPLALKGGKVSLASLAGGTLIVYPSQPRPSYADQVLSLLRDNGFSPGKIVEVREVQTALGLVAAQSGRAIVPTSMQHIQREDIRYMSIAEGPTSPIILSQRQADVSDNAELIREIGRSIFHQQI
jgi:LysR family transcriptional regulator, benzoate and cis,cis-muconate-responsive activator of ben and cat genes